MRRISCVFPVAGISSRPLSTNPPRTPPPTMPRMHPGSQEAHDVFIADIQGLKRTTDKNGDRAAAERARLAGRAAGLKVLEDAQRAMAERMREQATGKGVGVGQKESAPHGEQ